MLPPTCDVARARCTAGYPRRSVAAQRTQNPMLPPTRYVASARCTAGLPPSQRGGPARPQPQCCLHALCGQRAPHRRAPPVTAWRPSAPLTPMLPPTRYVVSARCAAECPPPQRGNPEHPNHQCCLQCTRWPQRAAPPGSPHHSVAAQHAPNPNAASNALCGQRVLRRRVPFATAWQPRAP